MVDKEDLIFWKEETDDDYWGNSEIKWDDDEE